MLEENTIPIKKKRILEVYNMEYEQKKEKRKKD